MRPKSDPLLLLLPIIAHLPLRSQILAMTETEPLSIGQIMELIPTFPRVAVKQAVTMMKYGGELHLIRGRYVTNARSATYEAKAILEGVKNY